VNVGLITGVGLALGVDAGFGLAVGVLITVNVGLGFGVTLSITSTPSDSKEFSSDSLGGSEAHETIKNINTNENNAKKYGCLSDMD
jgi:hypothetical protein|tara:strand:- start:2869 stop:3126 length:258 start_codon:yes stop_codon:yes gene_type:complete